MADPEITDSHPTLPTVFISYARSDSLTAEWLDDLLEQRGFEAHFDRELTAGESWAETLSEAIRSARVMVLLLSPDFFRSTWCQAELSEAFKWDKRILPVMVDRCMPDGPLQHIQWLDLTGAVEEQDKAVERLLALVAGDEATSSVADD